MKTNETSTLYTTMSNNIGQVKRENAQKEIERLNKQEKTNSWRIDESDFIFVEDEIDGNVHNPCERMEGYVWVTCEPLTTREQALAWWNNLSKIDKTTFAFHFNRHKHVSSLTSREIEEIWKNQLPLEERESYYGMYKPNQKQFKTFDESLFKAYINKFSDEDKVKCLKILIEELGQDHNYAIRYDDNCKIVIHTY